MSRILVLDGDAVSLEALQALLQRAQHSVVCAQGGRSCLALLSEINPEVVLVDLQLQGLCGLEVLRTLRHQINPPLAIFMSRFGYEQERAEAMRLGAFDCIEQPLNAELILAVVHNALSGVRKDGLEGREESHALARWTDVVVPATRSPKDMRTLDEWGRFVAVSKGGIRNWCYTARLHPKSSLQFMRVLRAVVRQERSSMAPEDLLNIVDRRTLAKLLAVAGGTQNTLPTNVAQFLDQQQILESARAVAAVRAALCPEQALSVSRQRIDRPRAPIVAGAGEWSHADDVSVRRTTS